MADQVEHTLLSISTVPSKAKQPLVRKNVSEDDSAAKRIHLDLTESQNEDASSENGDVDMLAGDAGTQVETTEDDSEVESSGAQPSTNGVGTSLSPQVLLEHTVHNNNILHVCGGGEDGGGGDGDEKYSAVKNFKPYTSELWSLIHQC